jgi:tol-pal system protein YbgF
MMAPEARRRGIRPLRLAATAAALVLVAVPAFAQTSMDDPLDARDARRLDRMEKVVRELRSIVFQLKDTGKPVVVQPADTDSRLQELTNRIDDLEHSLTRINGELETTSHRLDESRQANATLEAEVKALGDRVAALEKAQEPAPSPDAAAASGPAAPPSPAQAKATAAESFSKARELMLAGDYDSAERAFAAYVQTYPDGPHAAEAHYWLGKTLSVRGAHAQAASAYIDAIRGWPKTAWAPDAVVELARSLMVLKKPSDACAALAELKKRYPKPPASVKTRAETVSRQAKCEA